MGFIKAGFTGGFIGIVLSVTDIFVSSKILEKLSSVGLYIASSFGKVCINTNEIQCSLSEEFTTILATIVGNCIAYFIIGILLSLAISLIKMWFSTKSETSEQKIPLESQIIPTQLQVPVVQSPQIVVEQPQVQDTLIQQQVIKQEPIQLQIGKPIKMRIEKKKIKEARPKKGAKISKK